MNENRMPKRVEHYSYELDRVFFEQHRLPEAGYNLEVGSGMCGSKPEGWLQESREFIERYFIYKIYLLK